MGQVGDSGTIQLMAGGITQPGTGGITQILDVGTILTLAIGTIHYLGLVFSIQQDLVGTLLLKMTKMSLFTLGPTTKVKKVNHLCLTLVA